VDKAISENYSKSTAANATRGPVDNAIDFLESNCKQGFAFII
jgi:hypothetical protein